LNICGDRPPSVLTRTPGPYEGYRLKLHKTLGPELLQKDPVALGGGIPTTGSS
jgi:hypothetical protein